MLAIRFGEILIAFEDVEYLTQEYLFAFLHIELEVVLPILGNLACEVVAISKQVIYMEHFNDEVFVIWRYLALECLWHFFTSV